jgi:osmotically-inducible protein OsmY
MARDYERDRWGRRYDDDVERYDRDDRRRMRGDTDYGRARDYGDYDAGYRRNYGPGRGDDRDYGYGGRGGGSNRERDYGRDYERDAGVRSNRGREDERLRYRGDDREMSRNRDDREMNRNRYDRDDDRSRSRRAADDADWAARVPDHYQRRGPYEDYGWEAGESVLPEFRDPSVHRADYERRQDRDDRSWWERTRDGVASWFGGQNAEGERDEDMRGGYRGRGPHGYRRGDDRILEEVNDRLTDDDFLDASQIVVSVQKGEIVLAGYVYNRTSKRRAERLAESVAGVTNVENRLRVIPYGETAANNWDTRQDAGAGDIGDTADETNAANPSANAASGNRSS